MGNERRSDKAGHPTCPRGLYVCICTLKLSSELAYRVYTHTWAGTGMWVHTCQCPQSQVFRAPVSSTMGETKMAKYSMNGKVNSLFNILKLPRSWSWTFNSPDKKKFLFCLVFCCCCVFLSLNIYFFIVTREADWGKVHEKQFELRGSPVYSNKRGMELYSYH